MRAVLVISERDNVATALEPLEPGRRIEAGGELVVAIDPIPAGHKIALRPIGAGTAVVKYGSAIGTAVGDIAAGSHVHTHNVASSRGRGDLESPATPAEARLAEPVDVTPIERTR
jgi:predicted RecA/RadA family phage recombinase